MLPTIALYDSGVGGLHLLKALINTYQARYIYYADTANMPYGTKSPQEIQQLAANTFTQLLEYNPDCLIIACHTISSNVSREFLTSLVSCPIITMVQLVTIPAREATKNGRIGILGTPATIDSQAHQKSLLSLNSTLSCFSQPCFELASVIENNPKDPKLPLMIRNYLAPLKENDIDTLILACTHYEAVRSLITQEMGNGVTIIGASEYIAAQVKIYLPVVEPCFNTKQIFEYIVSGDQDAFQVTTKIIFGQR